MRILMSLAEKGFPPDIRIEKEARSLMEAGHDLFLLCPAGPDSLAEETVEGIEVTRVVMPRGLFKLRTSVLYLLTLVDQFWKRQTARLVERRRIEALHIHDLPMVKTGLYVAREFGIPVVADLHEIYPLAARVWSSKWTWKHELVYRIQRWERVERFCVRSADRVITVVEEAKTYYVERCGADPDKVVVVMNTEDPDLFLSLPVDEAIVDRYRDHFTISYVGGFGPHRGVETAILAMPSILQEVPNARLLLVGTGDDEDHLMRLAASLGLQDSVEFTGWQPSRLVPSYIRASRVCLIPYRATGHTDRSCPHKLFQYMVLGKPVVVSSMTSLSRLVTETGAGLVYPAGDASKLAEAVVRISRDGDLAMRLSSAGRQAVAARYNWQADGGKLAELYEGLS